MGIVKRMREWLFLRQVAAEIRKDPWLHAVVEFGNGVFNDPSYLDDNPLSAYLQKDATPRLRQEWAVALCRQVLPVAASSDRVVSCREWIFRICEQYAPVRVLMLAADESTETAAQKMYHPCVSGLHEHLDDLLKKDSELNEIYRRESGIPEAREFIRVYSLSKHLELRIADFARRQLGDFLDGDRDWLIPLLNSMCALVESNYRHTLGLPEICDGLDILEEQAILQRNVLKAYKDPLQGVPFACRCKEVRG